MKTLKEYHKKRKERLEQGIEDIVKTMKEFDIPSELSGEEREIYKRLLQEIRKIVTALEYMKEEEKK